MRERIASISSSESGAAVPAPPCERPDRDEPGETVSILVPRRLMLRSTSWRAPLPIADMTITEATPMITPSAVSRLRMALRRIATSAEVM